MTSKPRGSTNFQNVQRTDGSDSDRQATEPRTGISAAQQSGWCPTAIREILLRPLYRGVIVWGELQKIERGGTKTTAPTDAKGTDHRRCPGAPHRAEICGRRFRTVLESHSVCRTIQQTGILRDVNSDYLLSGLARCAHCGGPLKPRKGLRCDEKAGPMVAPITENEGLLFVETPLRIEQELIDKALLRAIGEALDGKHPRTRGRKGADAAPGWRYRTADSSAKH